LADCKGNKLNGKEKLALRIGKKRRSRETHQEKEVSTNSPRSQVGRLDRKKTREENQKWRGRRRGNRANLSLSAMRGTPRKGEKKELTSWKGGILARERENGLAGQKRRVQASLVQ